MRKSVAAGLIVFACAGAPAFAQNAPSVFDKPAATKTIAPKDAGLTIICTTYADAMVWEKQDGPTSENARLLRGGKAGCSDKAPAGAATLPTDSLALTGRKGDHLVFSAMDPNGSRDFVVVDVRSGKVVLKDATSGDPEFRSATAAGGVTTLAYRRGINAPCSLPNSGGRCWSSLVDDGKIPQSLASPMPNPSICAASYKKAKSPKDNPSIVAFDVETTIDAAGKVTTVAKGKVACEPMP